MLKAGYVWKDVLADALPQAKFVCVTRHINSVIRSLAERHSVEVTDDLVAAVNERISAIETMSAECGFPLVKSDEVVSGDYRTLEDAFAYCGMEFSREKADQCVDRRKWRD
jgi:hypothetical protein